MITANFDAVKNLLHISFEGETTVPEIEGICRKIEAMASAFKPGLRLLNDLSRSAVPSLDLREGVANLMKLMNRLGVVEVIRVIPDPAQDIGYNIMSLFHYGPDVRFRTVESCDQVHS